MKEKYPPFLNLEHTADLKIRAYGKTKEEVFVNMAYGMFYNICGGRWPEKKSSQKISQEIKVDSSDLEALLVDFLSELNYLADLNNAVFDEIKIKILENRKLEGKISGVKVEGFNLEIKAVTYHQLKIEKTREGIWLAEVIFDI